MRSKEFGLAKFLRECLFSIIIPASILLVMISSPSFSQTYWAHTYSTSGIEEAHSLEVFSDGSLGILGQSGANSSLVIKLDTDGTIIWQKNYSASGFHTLWSMQKTNNDGLILAGWISIGGSWDFIVIKLDSTGAITWKNSYGGSSDDLAYSVKQTNDGGFIVAGNTKSFGAGKEDIWIVKLSSSGILQWQYAYGGTDADLGRSIQQTSDGGYILAGQTSSFGAGKSDILVMKLNPDGSIDWSKTFGTASSDGASSIIQASDGGFLVAGATYAFNTYGDIWILRLDYSGNILWQRRYNNSLFPTIPSSDSVAQTSDGGFVLAGATTRTQYSLFILKIDANGNSLWQKLYGGNGSQYGYSIKNLTDGTLFAAGQSNSFGTGTVDFWVLKLDEYGTISYACPYIYNTTLNKAVTTVSANNITLTKTTTTSIATTTSLTAATSQLTSSVQCTAPPDYDISCNPSTLDIKESANKTTTCTVSSINSFNAPVSLSCPSLSLPPNVTCSFNPASVTPPVDGTIDSTLTIAVGTNISPGRSSILIRGTSGSIKHDTGLMLNILTAGGLKAEFINADKNSNTNTNSNLNNVFEPGEAIMGAPSWTNTGTSSIALTATASSFNGPAGATYTPVSSSANYGTIAAGQTANCYDASGTCYVFQVSNPAQRPATHWDANFHETLSTGDVKSWKLHIGQSFTDVPLTNIFYFHIESLLHSKITGGCTTSQYCPSGNVTRGQIAKFISVALANDNIPSSGIVKGQSYNCISGGSSIYTDVTPAYIFCPHIHYLSSEGVATQCGDGTYCPDSNITRDQMAIFIARAIAGGEDNVPAAYTNPDDPSKHYNCSYISPDLYFTDVSVSDYFCKHAHYLWALNIISGCGSNLYCPSDPITREQMAKFLVNAFYLLLYGP